MATKTKILTDGLTNKQRIQRMVERWPDDIPFEKALYHLHFMKEVMEAIEEAERGGSGKDHDELFDELERLCDEEENQGRVEAKSRKKSKGDTPTHPGVGNAKGSKVLRKATQKVRKYSA